MKKHSESVLLRFNLVLSKLSNEEGNGIEMGGENEGISLVVPGCFSGSGKQTAGIP